MKICENTWLARLEKKILATPLRNIVHVSSFCLEKIRPFSDEFIVLYSTSLYIFVSSFFSFEKYLN